MTEPMPGWAQPEGPTQGPASTPTPTAPAPAPVPLVVPKKKGSGALTNALLVGAALLAVGGLAFAGGRMTAPAAASGVSSRIPGANGQLPTGSFDPGAAGFVPGGLGNRAMVITGTVKSLDGSTLVITSADGTETTIDVSGSTYHAQAAATASDVTAGASVSVSVEGLGGGFRGPDASAAPGAGTRTITATDVTITGE